MLVSRPVPGHRTHPLAVEWCGAFANCKRYTRKRCCRYRSRLDDGPPRSVTGPLERRAEAWAVPNHPSCEDSDGAPQCNVRLLQLTFLRPGAPFSVILNGAGQHRATRLPRISVLLSAGRDVSATARTAVASPASTNIGTRSAILVDSPLVLSQPPSIQAHTGSRAVACARDASLR